MNPHSYNFWATCIVLATENHNFLLASCWSVDVVNGAEGDFLPGFTSIFSIVYFAPLHDSKNFFASSAFVRSLFNSALNSFFASPTKLHITLKNDADSNFWISLSLSTINLTATDWTLPALNPILIFFQRTGESSKPTSLSRTLLACWASTRFISMVLGFFTAWSIASLVISWKTILAVLLISSPNWFATCRPIASHSRSSSVAIQTLSAPLAKDFSSLTTLVLSGETMYLGANPFLISIPISFWGRSTTCPNDALTSNPSPRNFLIVADFAGDSTITKFFIEI